MTRLTVEQREQLLEHYRQGKTSLELAQEFGISVQAVCGLLARRGIPRRTPAQSARRYTLNEHVFEVVTEESAYWIGFLMADGTVVHTPTRAEVILSLAERDKPHLERFGEFLQSNAPLLINTVANANPFQGTTCYKVTACSQLLVSSLRQYGVRPQKTGSEQVSILETNRHFWRGIVDGDGYLGISGNYSRLELVGGEALLQQFVAFLKVHLHFCINSVKLHKSIYRIGFCGKTAQDVVRLLYGDCSVALERKMEKACSILALEVGAVNISRRAGLSDKRLGATGA
jgi:hypothetical protein